MTAQRLRAKPALEANYIILLHRASDRHRRLRRLLHRLGPPETGQCPMHHDNQRCKLVGRDLVMPQIATDNLRDAIRIDRQRVLVCRCVLPAILILAVVVVLAFRHPLISRSVILTI